MRFIFVCAREPNKNGKADQITTYYAKEYLEENNHEVDVFVCKRVNFFSLEFIVNIVMGVLSKSPFQVILFKSKFNETRFKKVLANKKYDKYYFHLTRSTSLLPLVEKDKAYIGLQISQSLNMYRISKELKLSIIKLVYYFESLLSHNYEKKLASDGFKVNFVGDADALHLGVYHLSNVSVVPHGIDIPIASKIDDAKNNKNRDVIFLANYSSEPNKKALEFLLDQIWPNVLKVKKDLFLTVAGRNIPGKLYSCPYKNVDILGEVDDPYELIASHRVFINPVRSSAGMQNKALSAVISGTVLLSTETAIEGMQFNRETSYIFNGQAEDCVKKLFSILDRYPTIEQLNRVQEDIVKNWSWSSKHKQWASEFLEIF